MGINYQKMKVRDTITPSEAHEKYLDIGGKNKSCRCRTDCSKSKTVNAGSMVSYATSTVIKGKKTCYVSCVWSVTKWGVGKDEVKQITLENW